MKITHLLGLVATLGLASTAPAITLFGVTANNRLVSFDTATPSTFTSSFNITGLLLSDGVTPDPFGSIANLAYHPLQDRFMGIDGNSNIYIVSRGGVANLINNSFSPTSFNAGLSYDPISGNFVYAGGNQNFSLTMAGAATANPNFVYGAGDVNILLTPALFALSIDPSFSTPYLIDSDANTLVKSTEINFPTNSNLTTVGGLGLDVTGYGGLIVDEEGDLYASLSTDSLTSGLYSINPTTGAASLLGSFGTGLTTIAVPEPSAVFLGLLSLVPLLRRRRA